MLEALPQILNILGFTQVQFWNLMTGCSVLAGYLALMILDRIFHIFDVIRH